MTQVITRPLVTQVIQSQRGPQGPAGSLRHDHIQTVPNSLWVVAHNFGQWPQVQVFSVGGREMLAEVLHMSLNVTNLYFDDPVSGIAIFE